MEENERQNNLIKQLSKIDIKSFVQKVEEGKHKKYDRLDSFLDEKINHKLYSLWI